MIAGGRDATAYTLGRVSTRDRDEGLLIRRDAALRLVVEGEITGWDALWLVVVPPPQLATLGAGRKTYRDEVRVEARELHAGGLTCRQVAHQLGVPFATAKRWIWPASHETQKQKRARAQELRKRLAA
jgi:hypothetical protein